jgi:hypothetical protein
MRNEAAGEGNAQELLNKIRDLVSAFLNTFQMKYN